MSDIESRPDSDSSRDARVDSQAGVAGRLRTMKSIGHIAGGVVHEINNMLMVLRGNLELIDDCEGEEEFKQRISAALEASSDIAALAQRLNEFSREDGLWPESLDINDVTRAAVERMAAEAQDGFEQRQSLAPDLWPVRADPEKAGTAVSELIRFVHLPAAEAAVEIETGNVSVPGNGTGQGTGEFVCVKVIGLPAAVTDENPPKLGSLRRRLIALGPAFGFARQSGGFVDADPNGTWAALYLPRDSETPES